MAAIGTGWVDGAWIQAGWATGAWSSAASATLSGTVTSATEDDIVAGGRTVVLTLIGDTWAAGPAFDLIRQPLINGMTSAGAEAFGWNAEVRDKEVLTAVVRTSDTVVTITLTAAPAYDITADETITVTIPAAALVTSAIDVVASPTFDVTFVAEEVVAPPGAGGGGGEASSGRGRKLPPFTGRGLFPDEPETEPPERIEASQASPQATEAAADAAVTDLLPPAGPSIDEVAAARARRADAQLAAQRVELRAAQDALERRDAELAMLAFLEAEQAATEARARFAAMLADDEAVIAAYLQGDTEIRARIAEIVGQLLMRRARRAADRPVLISLAGDLLANAEKGGKT